MPHKIIGPHDTGIAASIEANLSPQTPRIQDVGSHSLCVDRTDAMRDAYFDQLSSLIISRLAYVFWSVYSLC